MKLEPEEFNMYLLPRLATSDDAMGWRQCWVGTAPTPYTPTNFRPPWTNLKGKFAHVLLLAHTNLTGIGNPSPANSQTLMSVLGAVDIHTDN